MKDALPALGAFAARRAVLRTRRLPVLLPFVAERGLGREAPSMVLFYNHLHTKRTQGSTTMAQPSTQRIDGIDVAVNYVNEGDAP